MLEICTKMVEEVVDAAKAVFGVIKEKRDGPFKLTDSKPYVDAVNRMKPSADQSKEVFDEDKSFKDSMLEFIDAIAANKALVGREAVRRYGGMYTD